MIWKQLLRWTALGTLAVGGSGFGYLYWREPLVAPPMDVVVEINPERVARGKHLFQVLADCDGCHSPRDFSRFGAPVIASRRGSGTIFPKELGLPGMVAPRNITQDKETGIGAWTDGEMIRAIREGISRDGTALFNLMPYGNFRRMSDEDVFALVAYLRTLPPVRNQVPRSKLDFPVNLLMKSAPQPAGSVPPLRTIDPVARGEYLVNLALCANCHTRGLEQGAPEPGMRLAGGVEFRTPGGVAVSANITPHPETGIGRWTEQNFIDKFRQYQFYLENGSPKIGPENFTMMPWLGFTRMADEELKAIFAYLKSQPPVEHPVETHPVD